MELQEATRHRLGDPWPRNPPCHRRGHVRRTALANAPPVIRALFAVSRALDERETRPPRRESPPNAGKP